MARNTPNAQTVVTAPKTQLDSYTGVAGEVVFDSTTPTLVAMDGATAGGVRLAKESRKLIAGSDNVLLNGGTEADLSADITLTVNATGSGGGTEYTAGTGIVISNGVISTDATVVGPKYSAGDGIAISDTNVISVDKTWVDDNVSGGAGGSVVTVPSIGINDTSIWPKGESSCFEANAESLLTGDVKISHFLLNVPEINIVNQRFDAIDNKASICFTVPSDYTGETITVTVRAVDVAGNESKDITYNIATKTDFISTPVITAPLNNESVALTSLVFQSSPYQQYGAANLHEATQWQVVDADTGNILHDSGEDNVHFTSYTLPSDFADTVRRYGVHVRYKGSRTGWSDWSPYVYFTFKMGIETGTQRVFARNSSGVGTDMWCSIGGQSVRICVLDAAYRRIMGWGMQSINVSYATVGNTANNSYITGNSAAGLVPITDAELDTLWYNGTIYATMRTAKALCDLWAAKDNSVVAYTRTIRIDGVGCDVANILQLMRIFVERKTFDSFDPTLVDYPAYALDKGVNANIWFNGVNIWSSCPYDNDNQLYVHALGIVNSLTVKTTQFGILPVLELAL